MTISKKLDRLPKYTTYFKSKFAIYASSVDCRASFRKRYRNNL